MSNGGLRKYYEKCLAGRYFVMPKKEKDLARCFFNEKTVYGDYNGKKLFAEQDGKIDVAQIVKYTLDENKFSFLRNNADYDNFIVRRGAFFGRIKQWQDEENADFVLRAEETDNYLDAYQKMLINSMRFLSECEEELEKAEIKRFLDIYLFIDCVKSNQEKAVYISWIHPVMLLHAKKIRKDENLAEGGNSFMDELKRGIASMMLEKEMPKRLFNSTVIYTIDKNQCQMEEHGVIAARQIRSMSTLNSIDSIRILEKVLAAWRQKAEREKSADRIELKIAYFGEFSDMRPGDEKEQKDHKRLNIEEYLNLSAVRERYGLKDSCFRFVHFGLSDSKVTDFYQSEDEKEYYNLQEMGHLEGLFRNYDMAFFLDQGYYYRKAFQDYKESYASACEFNDYVGQLMSEKNKYNFQQILLLFWMKWGFRYLGDKSGEYEFGKNLHNNIRLRPEQDSCHVYAYISESRKVGDFDLETSNVCRGEFYYGHKMMVCHFSNQNNIDITSLVNMKFSPRYVICLNAWRLFKILYDEAFDLLHKRWHKYWQDTPEEKKNVSVVYLLQNVWIEWDFRNLVRENEKADQILLKLKFNKNRIPFISPEKTDVIEEELRELIEQIFRMALGTGKGSVKEYARQVITEAVKSACQRMEDFLFANYLKHCYDNYEISCVLEENGGADAAEELSVQTRQAIHAVIKKIDNMHLRIVENRGLYIKQDIIRECCEGIREDDFDKLLEKMKQLFARGFRNKDLLAHNINILC